MSPRPYRMSDEALLEWMLQQGVRNDKGCLLWPHGIFLNTGYGRIRYLDETVGVHRLCWALMNDKDIFAMDASDEVLHSCDNKLCYEYAHLHLGDASVNAIEAYERGQRKGMVGLANGNGRLSSEQIVAIRARLSNKESSTVVAADYGISPGYARCLVSGKNRRKDALN